MILPLVAAIVLTVQPDYAGIYSPPSGGTIINIISNSIGIYNATFYDPTIFTNRFAIVITNTPASISGFNNQTYTNAFGDMTNSYSGWKQVGGTNWITLNDPNVIANEGVGNGFTWALGTATNDGANNLDRTPFYDTTFITDSNWRLTLDDSVIGHIADFLYSPQHAPGFTAYPRWPAVSYGNAYYVDQTTGNDFNDGHTLLAPFRTVTAAANVATNGNSIFVGPGSYSSATFNTNVSVYGSGNVTIFTNGFSYVSGGELAYFKIIGTVSFASNFGEMYWHDIFADSTPNNAVDCLGIFAVAKGTGLIKDCEFKSIWDAAAITFTGSANYTFEGCRFIGINPSGTNNTVAAAHGFAFSSSAANPVLFNNCYFYVTNSARSTASGITNGCFVVANGTTGGSFSLNNCYMDFTQASNGVAVFNGSGGLTTERSGYINYSSGTNSSGYFFGNGGGLTNIPAAIAYGAKPVAVTVGASPFTYLNPTGVPLMVSVDDGAALFSLSLNGVAYRSSLAGSMQFILPATNSIVLTYPVTAPTFLTNKFF